VISVAACAGDDSANAASPTSCNNFKARFTDDHPALRQRAMRIFASALIDRCSDGFNPSRRRRSAQLTIASEQVG
jgi:hypothetical protein